MHGFANPARFLRLARWLTPLLLIAGLALNVFGTLIPFYSMAVYDRVIPNNALGSLGVLTTAAGLIIGFVADRRRKV